MAVAAMPMTVPAMAGAVRMTMGMPMVLRAVIVGVRVAHGTDAITRGLRRDIVQAATPPAGSPGRPKPRHHGR